MDRALIIRALLSCLLVSSLAACSGGGGKSDKPDAGPDLSTDDDPSTTDTDADSGTGGDDDEPPVCQTACAPDDCGQVPDGCGDFLDCDVCADGAVCGLKAPNKCAVPEGVCTPTPVESACADKCGIVSDGCADVYDCSAANGGITCAADELCGGYDGRREPNVCVPRSTACTPSTCEALGQECGAAADGCGGLLDCADAPGGGCGAGEQCGTGAEYGRCVAEVTPPSCTRRSAAEACTGTCGVVSDGCTGTIDCNVAYPCPAGTRCGGGNQYGVCVAAPSCTPIPEATACAGKCGDVSNGCEGSYRCGLNNGGDVCDQSEECFRSTCRPSAACTPKSELEVCASVAGHKACGRQTDQCSGVIDCGGCASGEECGLGGPSLCGSTTPVCTPVPVATACRGKCGTVANGCGGTYDCNTSNGGVSCGPGELCGLTAPSQCGASATCSPKTCAELGHSCGLASDGCGRVLNCWPGCSPTDTACTGSCPSASACVANTSTTAQSCVAGSPTCSGALCGSVPTSCSAAQPTRLTGTVRTPGRGTRNRVPVPNALVYIPGDPSAALPGIFEGVSATDPASCGRCDGEQLVGAGQSVLASAVTDYKGEFVLEGRIPVGVPFKLVVKIGKWRRVVEVPAGTSAACATRALSFDQTRLAASSTDGFSGTHLPRVAISTGQVDAMECVFRNLGIDDGEFGLPSSTSRIHMYRANGARMRGTCEGRELLNGLGPCSANDNAGCVQGRFGCSWSDGSVPDSQLFGSQRALNTYDMIVWDCEGGPENHNDADPRVLAYVNAGGRMFASHFSYTWIEDNGTMAQSSRWGGDGTATGGTGFVSLPSGPTRRTGANATKSGSFRSWLDWQGALTDTVAGQLDNPAVPSFGITDPRDHAGTGVGPSTDEWVYRTVSGTSYVQQLSFNTPYGATSANICGRVAYSGFHVTATDNSGNSAYFPDVCPIRDLSTQEKVLAFMLFDLATCVSNGDPPKPPECTRQTTASLCPAENDACGFLSDGCGGVVDCGGCSTGFYCDGSTCRPRECQPDSCASLGFTCGVHADGCGGAARNASGQPSCGSCATGQACGLDAAGQCGGCVAIPLATACQGKNCGTVSDGCGGTYDCGTCPQGQVCGAGGANVCGGGACTRIPQDEACRGKTCGVVSDGCGGVYTCGVCVAPDTCGGGGVPDNCGHSTCTPIPEATACAGKQCGWVSDGCGGAYDCGSCPNNGVCGGAGPNQCGDTCAPTSCAAQNAECGAIADRCGGLLSCGDCPAGQTCGAAGPNRCGSTTCTPRTCSDAGAGCGLVGDGCGGVLDCGTCVAPQSCGGAGVPNQCGNGQGGCNPLSCAGQNVACGQATDGCGGLVDCGPCPSGNVCERGQCKPVLR